MTPFAQAGLPGSFASLAAGALSFLSPCVLPLIPAYLSFISGESAADIRGGTVKRPLVLFRTIFFVAGFSLVFVLLAIIFAGGMRFVGNDARRIIGRLAGVLVILFALNTLFDFIPFLRGEWRARATTGAGKSPAPDATTRGGAATGALRALLLGMAFAAGWSPCIGPILSSILLYAGRSGNVAVSAWLLFVYSLGLGIPFLLAGAFIERALPVIAWFKRHQRAIRIVSAVLLGAFGLAMATDTLSSLTRFTPAWLVQ